MVRYVDRTRAVDDETVGLALLLQMGLQSPR